MAFLQCCLYLSTLKICGHMKRDVDVVAHAALDYTPSWLSLVPVGAKRPSLYVPLSVHSIHILLPSFTRTVRHLKGCCCVGSVPPLPSHKP